MSQSIISEKEFGVDLAPYGRFAKSIEGLDRLLAVREAVSTL